MVWEILDLESKNTYHYSTRCFCVKIGIKDANFCNRWRIRKTKGITYANRWYITRVEHDGE